jgi:polar amino acid transport system permease protein
MSLWPAHWSRQLRSSATMVLAAGLILLCLWALAIPLAWMPEPVRSNAQFFAQGARVTVELTLIAGVVGLPLGVLAALGKLSRVPPLRWLADLYVWIMRGTPLLLQILFVTFALPEFSPLLRMDEFTAACVALALNVGAYNAEAIRAGLLAVPKGQIEAARSLGLNRWYTFVDVTMPQAFKIALPPLVNNVVSLLKDSSLASVVGVVDLLLVSQRTQAASFQPVPCYIATGCIYLLLTTLMTQVSNAVERRFDVEGKLA